MPRVTSTRAVQNGVAGVSLVVSLALIAMLAGGQRYIASANVPLLAPFSGGSDQHSDAPQLDISAAAILPSTPQKTTKVPEEVVASLDLEPAAQPLLDDDFLSDFDRPLPSGHASKPGALAPSAFEVAQNGSIEEAPEVIDPSSILEITSASGAERAQRPTAQVLRQVEAVIRQPTSTQVVQQASIPRHVSPVVQSPATPPVVPKTQIAEQARAPVKFAQLQQAQVGGKAEPYLSAYEASQVGGSSDAPPLDLDDAPAIGDMQIAHVGNPASQIADTENPRFVRNPGVKASEITDTSAAPSVSSLSGWLSGVDISIEAIAYHEEINFDADALSNPGNNVYGLPDSRDVIELRPEFRFTMADLWLEASPRLSWSQTKTVINARQSSLSDFDADVIYGSAGYATGPFSIKAGRYVNLWGPSVFLSPSNPFHDRSTQISPFTELEARDYLEAAYAIPETNWTAGLVYNFNKGNQSGDDDPVVIARADWYGATTAFTGMVQGSEDWYGVGGYGQWTPNEATVLYGDGLIRYGERRIPDAEIFGLIPNDDKGWGVRALVGGSYTFEEGTTVSLEYLHNSEGYSSSEAERAFALNSYAIHSPCPSPLERRSVGALADIGFFDLGRHYLMGRISKDDLLEDMNISMLYAHNLEDQSGRLVGNVDWLVNDNTTLFANGVAFHGDENSEFGRFSDSQLTLGVRWRPDLGLF